MKVAILAKLPFLSRQARRGRKNTSKGNKDEYFTKNGGILLEKQITLVRGVNVRTGHLRILSEDEIEKATNHFDPDLIIRSYRGLSYYKGTYDDKVVGIKTSGNPDSSPELVDLLLTDVAIRTVLCHNDMIRIYGCCLETCIPITVHEFYPSRTLYEHLHGDMALEKPLTWASRLRVAIDVAYALSYMHTALLHPVVHRDIMSYGILLDSSFHARLSFFGHSVSITPGKKGKKEHHRWPVSGTPGYIDPGYIETQEVTEKCDVYSFGVLMLELLTSRDPFEMACRGNNGLVDEFVFEVDKNGLKAIVDAILLDEGNNMYGIERFTRLALKCVQKKGEERPSMIHVVEELWSIRDHR